MYLAGSDPSSAGVSRRTFLKGAGAVVLGASAFGSIASCARSGSGGKKSITIGMQTGFSAWEQYYKAAAPKFTELTGIEITTITATHDQMKQRFLTEEIGGTGAIDVYTTDQPWLPFFASKGYLEPLDDRLDDADRADFLPSALATTSYEGAIYGLPFVVHNSVLFYRTDLFEKAGITAPPTTWAEYREVAKALTDSGAGVYGTVVEGKKAVEPTFHYLDYLMQAGGAVTDADLDVVFDDKPARDAFEHMLGIQYDDKSSPEGAPGYDNADVHNLFIQGKLAMAPNWPYMYSFAQDESQSKVVDMFDVAVQPGLERQAGCVQSWGWGISASSKDKDLAWEWVKWASSEETLSEFGQAMTYPVPRTSSQKDVAASAISDRQKAAIDVMSTSVGQSDTTPPLPVWESVADRLSVGVSNVMSRQTTPDAEVSSMGADIKGLLEA